MKSRRVVSVILALLTVCALAVPFQSASALTLTTGRIIASGVAFRASASSNSKLITRLDDGDIVRLLAANVNAEWYKAEYANKTGFINRMYVSIEPSLESYQLDYTGTVVNCNTDINIRDAAGVRGKKIGAAVKGAQLEITQAYYTADWHQVKFEDQTGYVSAKYIELKANVDDKSLTGITVEGGTLTPRFSPKEYGYILTATADKVVVSATANDGVKVSIGSTGIATAKYTINSGNSKTIRISVDGKVRYSIYLVHDVLTVGTWNIKRGNEHLVEQGWLISCENPDIVGIQEVYINDDSDTDNLKSLRTKVTQYLTFAPTIDYSGGGQYGVGQISRFEPISNEKYELYDGGKEPRFLQRVVYEIDGKRVSVYNTHFSWESATIRAKQFAAVLKQMDADENVYRILTGDFNAKEAEFAKFKKDYRIVNTSSTKFYNYSYNRIDFNQIDNIIVSDNITVLNARAIPTEYSDHYPLFAFLRLN